jgi:hypothetical protein
MDPKWGLEFHAKSATYAASVLSCPLYDLPPLRGARGLIAGPTPR